LKCESVLSYNKEYIRRQIFMYLFIVKYISVQMSFDCKIFDLIWTQTFQIYSNIKCACVCNTAIRLKVIVNKIN